MSSDQKPLFFHHETQKWVPKSFRIFDWWLRDENLMQHLTNQLELPDGENVYSKLKVVKAFLKDWSKNAKNGLDDKQLRVGTRKSRCGR